MAIQTLGVVIPWAPSFAPRNWMFCDGQLLSIAQYQALFSLLGNNYGGDARTTFALPDLRGRVVVGEGSGPGISIKPLGERAGSESAYLDISHIPPHTHVAPDEFTANFKVSGETATEIVPAQDSALGAYYNEDQGADVFGYNTEQGTVKLNSGSVFGEVLLGNNGGNSSHMNEMPFTVMNYIICINGIYPSRS
ncbi:MAG: tail fiber protein [Cyclobacteriaceae bacterium]